MSSGFEWLGAVNRESGDCIEMFGCKVVTLLVAFGLKVLHEYKFEFLQIITSHEHYIPLCLPIMNRKVKNFKGE